MEEKKIKTVSEVDSCKGCPLQKLFPSNNFVPMQKGSLNRLGIGEAPGESEQATGVPFCGGSGTWLKIMYEKAGIKKDDVNLINCIQCRPPNNIYPTDSEARSYISKAEAQVAVKQCWKNHVKPVLEEKKWARVDLFGAKALESATGLKDGIYNWRGSPLKIPELGDHYSAIATLHPAAIAREQVLLPVVINDLRKGLQPPPEHYNLKPSLDEVKAFKATEFALDIETNFWWGDGTKVTMVGLSDKPFHAIVVPFQGPYIAELRRIVCDAKTIVTQNGIAFDIPILFKALGVEWQPE